jgi:hypothetical protein
MTPLCELARKYGTDKFGFHHYTEHYHRMFADRRISTLKVLEIGIGDSSMKNPSGEPYEPGASLRMWKEYFYNAYIYGLDNNRNSLVNEEGIASYFCDQGDVKQLKALRDTIGMSFDLIVDDGSHVPEHQAQTAIYLVPLLIPDRGIYVIEDVWPYPCEVGWSKEPFGLRLESIPYPAELIQCGDNRNSDDHLVVIRA